VENLGFEFDNTFSEFENSDSLYYSSIQPQIDFLFDGGIVTCFAYGQTGSGKTYTMGDVQKLAVNDFFAGAEIMKEETGKMFTFTVSYFEIYNGKVYDLLDNHTHKKVQEDRNGQIQIPGLKEVQARSVDEMSQLIEYGLSERKTKSTACNDTSSRSHAIGTISIKEINKKNQVISESGKLLLVDLAGSEKAQDSQSNNKQRRIEGAEINTSLLSLKECIRAMDSGKKHIPFRQSKLTMVLRDSFTGSKNRTHVIMIACISPDHNSSDHTLNTLRYAERLKCTTDDEETVEKYMASKPITNKSQDFAYILNDNMEESDSPDEDEPNERDTRLYQSHDFNYHTEENRFMEDKEQIYQPEVEQEYEDTSNNFGIDPAFFKPDRGYSSINKDSSPLQDYEPKLPYEEYKVTYDEPKGTYQKPTVTYEEPIRTEIPRYEPKVSAIASTHRTSAYTNYDSKKYKRLTDPESRAYRKPYQNTDVDQQNNQMQVDSDGSDSQNSPHLYVSKNNRANNCFSDANRLKENTQSVQLDLKSSSINIRPYYRKDVRSRVSDVKENTYKEYDKHPISNSTWRQMPDRLETKPINSSISYHRHTRTSKPEDDRKALSNKYKDLVSTSSYGRAMVASFNSYFKHDREHIRPTK